MIKKIFMVLSLCLLLGIAMCGCGQSKPQGGSGSAAAEPAYAALFGTWTQVTDDGTPSLPDLGIPSGYTFYGNGTGVDLFWDMTFTYTVSGDVIHISYDNELGEDTDYKFTFEGDTLTMTRAGDADALPMLYQQKPEEPEEE